MSYKLTTLCKDSVGSDVKKQYGGLGMSWSPLWSNDDDDVRLKIFWKLDFCERIVDSHSCR